LKNQITILLLVALLCFFSCKKKETSSIITNNKKNGQLVIYTKTLDSTRKEIPLTNVLIMLYASDVDRISNIGLLQSKTTDSLGAAHFYQLEKEEYFIKISQPKKGTFLKTVDTPDKSTTFYTYVFP
jgi:hypothetical protein